jgi:hypothetical protein
MAVDQVVNLALPVFAHLHRNPPPPSNNDQLALANGDRQGLEYACFSETKLQPNTKRALGIWSSFSLVLCGVAAWEFLLHLPFDISILAGKRKFKWPMVITSLL